jgi:hypothetical protein
VTSDVNPGEAAIREGAFRAVWPARFPAQADAGCIAVRIAATYPLEGVRDAFRRLAQGHVGGKIVLLVAAPPS